MWHFKCFWNIFSWYLFTVSYHENRKAEYTCHFLHGPQTWSFSQLCSLLLFWDCKGALWRNHKLRQLPLCLPRDGNEIFQMGLNFLNLMLEVLHARVVNRGTLWYGDRSFLVKDYVNFFTFSEFLKSDVPFLRKPPICRISFWMACCKKEGIPTTKILFCDCFNKLVFPFQNPSRLQTRWEIVSFDRQ